MSFEWGSELCDPTVADLDDRIDVELHDVDSASTDPGIIVMYDA